MSDGTALIGTKVIEEKICSYTESVIVRRRKYFIVIRRYYAKVTDCLGMDGQRLDVTYS